MNFCAVGNVATHAVILSSVPQAHESKGGCRIIAIKIASSNFMQAVYAIRRPRP